MHRSSGDLSDLLHRIDNKPYGAYKDLYGSIYDFTTPTIPYMIEVVYVQGDPYAAPSRLSVKIPLSALAYPADLYSNSIRKVALADYLTRSFCRIARREGADIKEGGQGWGGAKGGQLKMDEPGQHILARTSAQVFPEQGQLEVRFNLGLPARGRSIEGGWCHELLFKTVPMLIKMALAHDALDQSALRQHVLCAEDQEALRGMLDEKGLTAFVKNGAVLPRRSGASDLPQQSSQNPSLFQSPPSMQVAFTLPNCGRVEGMGVKKGVTLIVGGGFHGKSTLLGALEVGIYNHIPGDGREYVVCNNTAVKICAEDGRSVTDLDISPFINNLPRGRPTTSFSTTCASGSTSQSANILEQLELGCTCLMLDEDTCATNFMYRDHLMGQLVSGNKEPITPFLERVKELYATWGVSTVMVVGGCGAYFSVADSVIMMDSFEAKDVTAEAQAIVAGVATATSAGGSSSPYFSNTFSSRRGIETASLRLRDGDQMRVKDLGKIQIGRESQDANGDDNYLDLRGVNQLTETGQTKLIAEALQTIASSPDRDECFDTLLEALYSKVQASGLDAMVSGRFKGMGDLSYVRKFELASAVNRWRSLRIKTASSAAAPERPSFPTRQESDASHFSMDSTAFDGNGSFDEYDDHPMGHQGRGNGNGNGGGGYGSSKGVRAKEAMMNK
jgi:predicted ABC-class ATPase